MSTPRRRMLRSARASAAMPTRRQIQIDNCRSRLERERVLPARRMTRLKWAFHAVEKQQVRNLLTSAGDEIAVRR